MPYLTRRQVVYGLIGTGVAAAVLTLGYWCVGCFIHRPAVLLDRLLAGDDTIEISTIIFMGQQEELLLRDTESLRYLTAAFRAAEYCGYRPRHSGKTYSADVSFSRSGSFQIGCCIPKSADGLSVSPNWHTLIVDDPRFYWVTFPEPVPQGVKILLGRLRNP